MAFCTRCGASLAGAFCSRCGARAGREDSTGAPPPANPAVPAQRRTSPIVWVLVAVLGIFSIGAGALMVGGAILAHKVRRDGAGATIAKVLAAVNPNLEVARTDETAGTVTVRDRRNGKEFTLGLDAARNGSFTLNAEEDGKRAMVVIGGEAKAPAWVPQYPGSSPTSLFSGKGESERESGEVGGFTFATPDSPAKVVRFYEDKARELDLPLRISAAGTVVAGDEDRGRFLKVMTIGLPDLTRVTVTYGRKL
jgi:hypothetical protein